MKQTESFRRKVWRRGIEIIKKGESTMRKNFGAKAILYPMPVLIIGTYDEDGKIDLNKFSPITYDPVNHTYRKLGDVVGKAFSDGLKLK